jgi:hypothetical protein
MENGKLIIKEGVFTPETLFNDSDRIKYFAHRQICDEANRRGFIETSELYVFKMEGFDSWIKWDVETNNFIDIVKK